MKYGTGAMNIDGCRVGTAVETWPKSRSYAPGQIQPGGVGITQPTGEMPAGRWPANLIHDGSDEVVGLFPVTKSVQSYRGKVEIFKKENSWIGESTVRGHNDSGSAARFFYCAKASKADRNEGCEGLPLGEPPASARSNPAEGRQNALGELRRNHHPTVKPTALMRYLCRLVTPPGGTVLDPFMGSGSTGKAAALEGFKFIGIELEKEYTEIAERRIGATQPLLQAITG
jgi:site-specific DNA-methyltransferase (adenine-specific)